MTVGEKRLTYQTCPQCGQQNRAAFHCCHHCGYVFPKARKKLKLTGEDMGEIVGALLGLISGLLLWDELRLLGAILFFFGGSDGGRKLCRGPRADVRNALTGCVVGVILGLFGIITQGGSISSKQIAYLVSLLPMVSGVAWRGMAMGTLTIRIGGIVGAIVSAITAILIKDVAIVSMLIFVFAGAIAGIGMACLPRRFSIIGSIVGMAVWLGWLFAPSPIAAGLSMGLFLFIMMMAAFYSGHQYVLGE